MSVLSYIKDLFVREKEPEPAPIVTQHTTLYAQGERELVMAGKPDLDENGEDQFGKTIYARVLKEGDRYVYEIVRGGIAFIRQDYHPDKPGAVPMTGEEANALAQALVEHHTNNPTVEV